MDPPPAHLHSLFLPPQLCQQGTPCVYDLQVLWFKLQRILQALQRCIIPLKSYGCLCALKQLRCAELLLGGALALAALLGFDCDSILAAVLYILALLHVEFGHCAGSETG
jgi:hypothetical protein